MEIIIGGDFFPGNRWEKIAANSPELIWTCEIKELLSKADFRIINLETPLTHSTKPLSKSGPNIKCAPSTINSIKYADINLVTLANNHVFDYGIKGLEDTLEVCRKNGIDTVGAGMSLEESRLSYLIPGTKVRVLNYCQNEFGIADEENPGSNTFCLVNVVNDVKKAKENKEFALVIIHYGMERYELPPPQMQKYFRFIVESGADVIVSHHTHTISGFEKYKDGIIFYGIGNLLFDWPTNDNRALEGTLLKLSIEEAGLESFELIPYNQSKKNRGITILSEADRETLFQRIDNINAVITSNTELKAHWDNYLNYLETSYYVNLMNKNHYIPAIVRRLPFLKKLLFKDRNIPIVLNMLRNESLREASIGVLKKLNTVKV